MYLRDGWTTRMDTRFVGFRFSPGCETETNASVDLPQGLSLATNRWERGMNPGAPPGTNRAARDVSPDRSDSF
jgi:hypothetical protein